MAEEQVRYDVEGYEKLTAALTQLVNNYPALLEGEKFSFSTLEQSEGIGVFPTTGAVIQSERESITGHVVQMCAYPFTVVFRASGLSQNLKAHAKEWLDTLGCWLERQTVYINDQYYTLAEYPALTGTREIRNISRQTPAYLAAVNEDKSEDWVISLSIQYRNEFDK